MQRLPRLGDAEVWQQVQRGILAHSGTMTPPSTRPASLDKENKQQASTTTHVKEQSIFTFGDDHQASYGFYVRLTQHFQSDLQHRRQPLRVSPPDTNTAVCILLHRRVGDTALPRIYAVHLASHAPFRRESNR